MGYDMCEREGEFPLEAYSSSSLNVVARNRFKVPRKFVDHCNGVHIHASVPRKLRSARKKRNRESIFLREPGSKTLKHTMNGQELPKKTGRKRSKLSIKMGDLDWSPTVSGPITKDEEEVAETLYALAGMFPEKGTNDEKKLDGDYLLPSSSLVLLDLKENKDVAGSEKAEVTSHPSTEESAVTISLSKPVVQEKSDIKQDSSVNEGCWMVSDSAVPSANIGSKPMLCKGEIGLDKPLPNSVSNLPAQSQTLLVTNPDISLGMDVAVECKQEHHKNKDRQRLEGPVLWPGLSLVTSHAADSHGSYLQNSTAKVPSWLSSAVSASRSDSCENHSSIAKVSEVATKKMSRRCAVHVYISHLIHIIQNPNRKERLLLPPNEMRPRGPKQEVFAERDNSNTMISECVSTSTQGHSSANKNPYEANNGVFQLKQLHDDPPKVSPASALYTLEKQSYDSLSLSARDGLKVNNSFNKAGSRMEPFSHLRAPYIQTLPQQQGALPFSIAQNQYPSSSYLDKNPSAEPQAPFQLPHFPGHPLHALQKSLVGSTKQQQQRSWPAHIATQVRSTGASTMATQYSYWPPSVRHNSHATSPYAQASVSPSAAPHELQVIGTKFRQMSHQQQLQVMSLRPLSAPSRTSGLDFHPPSMSDESGGTVHTPLQLLCQEHL